MAEETGDATFKSTLDEASQQKARDELNERNEKDRMLAVQTLRKWVLEQDWLKTPTDFAFLLKFLRAKKFSQLEARKRLEHYWKARTLRPEWFRGTDPSDPIIQRCLKQGVFRLFEHVLFFRLARDKRTLIICCSPKRDRQGRRVVVARAGCFNAEFVKEVGLVNVFKTMVMVYDWITFDEIAQVNGLFFISDYTGLTMQLVTAFFNPEAKKDFLGYFQNGLPARIKSINAYNEPAFFDMVFAIVSPMMSKKIKERFHLHGRSLVKIYKEVGYECLPDEYLPDDYEGPRVGSMSKIVDDMLAEMTKPAFVNYIRDLSSDKYGVDKSRMPAKPQETGSYRKLNVD